MIHCPTREHRVIAVVVAFRPEPALFAKLIEALDGQVAMTLVVDNGAGMGLEALGWHDRLERIDMQGNAGLAAAQNAGIRRARAAGATHVLILDHDSIPGDGMTQRLIAAADQLKDRNEQVAAVGADYRDARHQDSSPFVVMQRFRIGRVTPHPSEATVPVPFLISSGSLIGVEAIEAIGLMEEKLFIDYVDVEWCLRAGKKGWRCFGVPGARLDHRIGDDLLTWGGNGRPVRLFGRTFPLHSPIRQYYMFRNGCWLMARHALPWHWKLLEARRLAAWFGAYALFAAPRGKHLGAMAKGVLDGIRGRMGPA